MEQKVFRAFVRNDGQLQAMFVEAETMEEALKKLRAEPKITEIQTLSEEETKFLA